MARERAVAALAGDDRGHAAILQPAEQAPQLDAQRRGVLEGAEQGLDRVDDDARGADLVDRRAETQEQTVEVPVSGLLDLRAGDVDVVDDELAVRLELGEVEAQRRDVGREIRNGLLEGDEDAALAKLDAAAHEELHREQRLAAAGRAADERRAPTRQSPAGDLVEAADSRRRLGQRLQAWRAGSRRA